MPWELSRLLLRGRRLMTNNSAIMRGRDELWNKKWRVFEKRAKLFRYIPFVDFVMLAGSMATGKINEQSDFDVILGVKRGRVFTAWFLSSFMFQLRGWREHPGVNKSNRVAMAHLATPGGYELTPPYDAYWENLYRRIVPAMGNETLIEEFFRTNLWMNPPREYKRDEKYLGSATSGVKMFLEFLLGGKLGNFAENILKKMLVKRLENPEKLGDRKSTRLNSSHIPLSRMPSSA